MKFEENLKALRLSRMLNQDKVAEAIHVSRSTYSQYERGTRQPNVDMLYAIAKFYGVRVDALFNYNGHRFISDVNFYTAITDQERRLVDTFGRLSELSKGKLLERADVLEAEDLAMFSQMAEQNRAV